jgi:hypothetical protein
VRWEDTYFSRLRAARPDDDLILAAMGGATIEELLLRVNYYVNVDPDVVVLHCGIVDCAPRALRKWELQVASRLKLYRAIRPLTHALRKYRRIRYTNPGAFSRALEQITLKFSGRPVLAVGILPGGPAYDAQVPGVSRSIAEYNGILARHTTFIDTSDFPRDGIVDDFVHLNADGHRVMSERLGAALDQVRRDAGRPDRRRAPHPA